jgi:translocation and assembly module TamB
MKRPLLIIFIVLILLTTMLMAWLTTTGSGLNWIYQQTKNYLPADIHLVQLEGRLIGPITLSEVEYAQQATHIKTGTITFDWHPVALLKGKINISHLHIQSMQIALPEANKTELPRQPQNLTLPDIKLPWRMSLADVQINNIVITRSEQTVQLQQIKLDASSLFSQINIEQLAIRADNFMVNIQGELQPTANYAHDLNINWQIKLPSSSVINGSGQLSGDIKQTHLTQQLTAPLQLTLNAVLNNLLTQLNWQAELDVSAFNTTQIISDWPPVTGQLTLQAKGDLNTATVSGKLNGYYAETGSFNTGFQLQRLRDNSIQIDQMGIQLPGNKTQLNAQGQWHPGANGGDVKLTLNWQNLRWPMQGTLWFDSARGHGSITGTLDHYQIQLATESPWPQAAPSYWQARAEGDSKGLSFRHLSIKALNGVAIATGRVNWSPGFSWQADVQVKDVDPARRWPDWPGKLQAKISSNGHMDHDQIIADADIRELNGSLRGYPVTLRSRLKWRDKGLDITAFEFHSGTSQVSAQGRLGDRLNLDWWIEASNLAELYPQARGQFKATGQLAGRQQAPLIKASLVGKNLSLPDYQIGNINGEVALDLWHWQQIEIQLAAQALTLNGYDLQAVDISADTQHLHAHVTSDLATLQLELKGDLDAKGWQGQITRADINSSQFANWQIDTPATLGLSENTLQLAPLCWHSKQQASICGSVNRQDHAWQSRIQVQQLPLQMFGAWLPPDLKIEGILNADSALQIQTPHQLLGHVQITLPPGVVSYPLLVGEHDQWPYRGGELRLNMDKQGVKSTAEMTMNNGDQFHLHADLPGAQLLALDRKRQAVHAGADLTISDLGLITALIPDIQDLKGDVNIKLSVTGTLAQPMFSGQASISHGEFRLPRLGLNIDQFDLLGQSDGLEKIKLQVHAHSGDGNIVMQGETLVNSAAGWPTELSIKGDQFEISRIPEARVLVSPDLQVKLQHHAINITGKVDIPFAKIQPRDMTSAATVSEDAVIVGGEPPVEEKWAIRSKVRLTLGERVNFFGFGFDGRLGGSLLLEDQPGHLTTATGEINIPEGRYRAYGQRLDIEIGRLLFTGGPLTNPGLDLRAVRHINNITAGVIARGTLTQPQLELFSIPSMDQTDMLSYLMLGRPMETASGTEGAMMAKAALAIGLSGGDKIARLLGDRFGLDEMRVESSDEGDQASLVVGRYLSPKIYVSYGVGLIEAINTFSVRYKINDSWQIKAESGAAQGADIFYIIDR